MLIHYPHFIQSSDVEASKCLLYQREAFYLYYQNIKDNKFYYIKHLLIIMYYILVEQ